MTKLIKGLGFFGLGFVLAIIFCFTIVFLYPGSANRNFNGEIVVPVAHRQPFASSDSLITSVLLAKLEQETAQGYPFDVRLELRKLFPDGDEVFVIETDKVFQSIFEKRRCELVNAYYENNSYRVNDYVTLLKTLSPQYCSDVRTERNIVRVLADFSLNQDWDFRRKVYFDSAFMHSLRAFAKQKTNIARALANFYVVLSSDALRNNYLKLSVFLLRTSQEIYSDLPAQNRMLALIEEQGYYLQIVPDVEADAYSVQHHSWFGVVFLIGLLIFVGWVIFLYIMNRKQANEMNVEYLMQKYDWSDEPPTAAMVANEIQYDVNDMPDNESVNKSYTPEPEVEIEVESNPKVISIHKDKPQK
jgi:hypothetical protein